MLIKCKLVWPSHDVETLPLVLYAYGELEFFFVKIIDELEEFTSDKEIAHKAFKLDSQMFIFVRINYDWDTMLYLIDNLVSNITS